MYNTFKRSLVLWFLAGIGVLGVVSLIYMKITDPIGNSGDDQAWPAVAHTFPECNGVFIGPSALLTATHCDFVADRTAQQVNDCVNDGDKCLWVWLGHVGATDYGTRVNLKRCFCEPNCDQPLLDLAICETKAQQVTLAECEDIATTGPLNRVFISAVRWKQGEYKQIVGRTDVVSKNADGVVITDPLKSMAQVGDSGGAVYASTVSGRFPSIGDLEKANRWIVGVLHYDNVLSTTLSAAGQQLVTKAKNNNVTICEK